MCERSSETTTSSTVTGGADVNVAYFDNDMVQQQRQTVGGVTHTQTFTLDPSGHRIVTQNDSVAGLSTNNYADGGDSPAWTSNPSGWTRNIQGLGGLGAIETYTGGTSPTDTVALQLTDMTGNVVATLDDSPGALVGGLYDYDSFGASVGSAPAPSKYGWLGGRQRAADDLGGIVLMGYRLYNPGTGRFLSVDPVPGGSCNAYDYACQDGVNSTDLSGRWRSRDDGRVKTRNDVLVETDLRLIAQDYERRLAAMRRKSHGLWNRVNHAIGRATADIGNTISWTAGLAPGLDGFISNSIAANLQTAGDFLQHQDQAQAWRTLKHGYGQAVLGIPGPFEKTRQVFGMIDGLAVDAR